ncbi:oxidoreductase [Gottschalkia purinilytica]|uniref:Oxidoreductase n=1 Tax=Gottschalkia purinilytica TaxID=1503 RepID=A0A0L0WF79_GOTPU|nr:(S)-benzoin forming benzil reductase [Gottschalkia purinilytica]KNF10075.1 oxidoreductase [Gottschalkia purinilytica]
MKYIIITGTSRGLGESLAKKSFKKDNHIICISRKKNTSLIEEAKEKDINLDYFEYDLNDTDNIDTLMKNVFDKIETSKAEGVYLINNAGTVSPIKPIEKCEKYDIIRNINVNLTSLMLITSFFMKYTKELEVEKRVINISSGASEKAYHGWGCYCTSKAGIDMFTKCIALEEENKDHPVKIVSFTPGIMDTNMQKEIRSSKEEDFIQLQRFIDFKEKGKLLSTEIVAGAITDLLHSDKFKQGSMIDISECL